MTAISISVSHLTCLPTKESGHIFRVDVQKSCIIKARDESQEIAARQREMRPARCLLRSNLHRSTTSAGPKLMALASIRTHIITMQYSIDWIFELEHLLGRFAEVRGALHAAPCLCNASSIHKPSCITIIGLPAISDSLTGPVSSRCTTAPHTPR